MLNTISGLIETTRITTMFKNEETPQERINRLEETLSAALSRRQSFRNDLKTKKRKAVMKRNSAEQQLESASGHQLQELRNEIDAQEAHITELEDRMQQLTDQITAIRRRFPRLEMLRMDLALMKDLRGDISWEEDVDKLMDELQTEDIVTDSAGAELNSLLRTIDQLTSDADPAGTRTTSVPDFTAQDNEETEDDEDHTTGSSQ